MPSHTQEIIAMKILKFIPTFLFLTACATPVVVTPDYSGLGSNAIGKVLRYSIFTGETGINYAVGQLVNTQEVLSSTDQPSKLESLGFICHPAPEVRCTYDGYAKSEVENSTESKKKRFKTTVHIDVSTNSSTMKVDSRTDREKY